MKKDTQSLFDNYELKMDLKRVCGIDEAGRGPIAGPFRCSWSSFV